MPENEVVSNSLVEQRERFQAKQTDVAAVYRLAGQGTNSFNMSSPAVLKKLGAVDSNDAVAKLKEMDAELTDMGAALQNAEMKFLNERNNLRLRLGGEPVDEHRHPSTVEKKTFGQLFVESKSFMDGLRSRQPSSAMVDMSIKTLFQTTAGWAPESIRTGDVVLAATRPPQLVDIIPVRSTQYELVKYMEQSTRTQNAAEVAEGTAYKESVFVFTERESPVRKITTSLPVTDEQLQDVGEVAAILDNELRVDIRTRLDQQIWDGDAAASPPEIAGFFDYASAAHANGDIQTLAQGAGGVGDSIFDAVFSAMMSVRTTGRANPSAVVLHPDDWATVRLTRTELGEYVMGNPGQAGVQTLFGLPIVLMEAGSQGTGLVGDFATYCYIAERRGIDVQAGYSGTQFVEGKKTLRADIRVAFVLRRPAAFCAMTSLGPPSP